VGLSNDFDPDNSTVTLWDYTLCGQYPDAVPAGATVTVHCPYNLPPFRYVIVQFPLKDDRMNVCEIEVFAQSTTTVIRSLNSFRLGTKTGNLSDTDPAFL